MAECIYPEGEHSNPYRRTLVGRVVIPMLPEFNYIVETWGDICNNHPDLMPAGDYKNCFVTVRTERT